MTQGDRLVNVVDWLPLKKTVEALHRVYGDSSPASMLAKLEALGGPFESLIDRPRRFLPQSLKFKPAPPPPPPAPSFWSRWFRRRRPPAPVQVVAPPPSAADWSCLRGALCDLQVWLFERNLRRLVTLVGPFHEDVPVEAARITKHGIQWALAAYETFEETRSEVAFRAPDKLTESGDYLALHWLVEDYVSQKAELVLRTASRATGGLRTEAFLRVYPARNLPGFPAEVAEKLRRVVAASPLTQIIYFDAVGMAPQGGRVWQLAPNDRSPAWREAWFAQLARTFCAALRSKPPSYEEQQDVERRLLPLRESFALRSQIVRPDRRQREVWQAEDEEREALAERQMCLDPLVAAEYLQRFGLSADILHPAVPHAADTALHMSVLTMFVRQISSETFERIVQAWSARESRHERGLDVREIGFGAEGPACAKFTEYLFGCTRDRLQRISLSKEQRQALIRLFDAEPMADDADSSPDATGTSVEAMAQATGLLPSRVAALHLRFQGKAGGIRLPAAFGASDDRCLVDGVPRSASPADVLALWSDYVHRTVRQQAVPSAATNAAAATVEEQPEESMEAATAVG